MKRSIILVFLFSTTVVTNAAQDVLPKTQVIDLIVLKKEWRFQVYNPVMNEDPTAAATKEVGRQQTMKNKSTPQGGITGEVRTIPSPSIAPAGSTYTGYIYEMKVKNVGKRQISSATLEYIFIDPSTNEIVGRREFTSTRPIGPGRSRDLVFRSQAGPTGALDARSAGTKPSFEERVLVKSVTYSNMR